MEMAEFNTKMALINDQMNKVYISGTDENLANLMIAATLNGLVLMDCNKKDGWVPTPICSFFVYKEITTNKLKSMYLFPSDQAIPE